MTKIEHTNFIIDDFSIAKRETNRIYTHILTHIHTDHLKGLHDGWNYGPIYCTEETRALLLYRFPNLPSVKVLERNVPTQFKMSSTMEQLTVTVTLFDANHCAGSVMVLLQGYMGSILYTGDIRFDRGLFSQYTQLYPNHLHNEEFKGCSKHIDILYLDNTFLKKKFDFPPKGEVLKMALDFIQHLLDINQHTRIFIGMDSYGKEEVLVAIAQHFSMQIVVDEQRYECIKAMGIDSELFTTQYNGGIVEVVRKNQLYDCIAKKPESIGIVLSGWVNHPKYRFNNKIYCLPYSLHSNYREIHEFVNSIQPSFIYPIVHDYPDENRFFYAERGFSKRDLVFNQDLFPGQEDRTYSKEIQELRRLYCAPPSASYQVFINNVELQETIAKNLLPVKVTEYLTNEKIIMAPIHMQTVQRKKYKLGNSRNQQEINRLKNQIKLKKKIIEGERIDIIDDNEQGDECIEISQGKSSNKKHNNDSLINVDNEDIVLDELEVEEVDPFCAYIRKKSGSTPQNSKSISNSASATKKLVDSKLIENIRNNIKNKYHTTNSGSNNRKSLKQQKKANSSNTLDKYLSSSDSKEMESKGRKIAGKRGISQIQFNKLDEIKILKTKEEFDSYLLKNPNAMKTFEEFLKKSLENQMPVS